MQSHRLFISTGLIFTFAFAGAVLAAQPGKRKPDPECGADFWKQSCWFCHGNKAIGDGPSASALMASVPNLRGTITRERFPELIEVIQNGRGAMPGYQATIDRHDSRRILIFLESLDADDTKAPAASVDEPAPSDKDGGAERE